MCVNVIIVSTDDRITRARWKSCSLLLKQHGQMSMLISFIVYVLIINALYNEENDYK